MAISTPSDINLNNEQRVKIINGIYVSSLSEAKSLISELKILNGQIKNGSELANSINDNYFDSKLNSFEIDSILNSLNNIEEKENTSVKNKQLNSQELKELLSEYDKSLVKNKDKEIVLNETFEKYKDQLNKKIELEKILNSRQKIENNIKEELLKSDSKIENVDNFAKLISNELIINENELVDRFGKEKALIINEEIQKEIISQSLGNNEIEIKSNKHEFLTKDDKNDLIDFKKFIEEKVFIDNESQKISDQIINNIEENNEISHVNLNKSEIKSIVLKHIEKGILLEDINFLELNNEIQDSLKINNEIELTQRVKEIVKFEANNIKLRIESLNESNTSKLENVQQKLLEEKIYREIVNKDKNITLEESKDIKEYSKFVSKIFKKSEIDLYRKEILDNRNDINSEEKSRAWNETKLAEKILKMNSKESENFLNKYKELESKIPKRLNIFRNSNSKTVNDFIEVLNSNPKTKALVNRYQNISSVFKRFDGFLNNKLLSNFREKIFNQIGNKLVSNIKNSALKSFAESSFNIFAKQGLKNGLSTLLKGLLSGTSKIAASGLGAGATAAGATAGLVSGPVGWIIMAAVAALNAFKKLGGLIKKLGIDLGIKKLFQDTFGNKFGGFIGGIAEVGAILITLPAIAIGAISVAALTPIIIGVICVLFIYQLFLGNQISSLVPPQNGSSVNEENTYILDATYNQYCEENSVCSLVKYLNENGISRINKSNWESTKDKLISLNSNNFDKDFFIKTIDWAMNNRDTNNSLQCIKFAQATNEKLFNSTHGYSNWWANNGSCKILSNESVGVNDFLIYNTVGDTYHIEIVTVLRTDNTFVLSDANSDGNGLIKNKYGNNIFDYISSKNAKIWRCE